MANERSESITLYYREGSSDKVYQVSLEPEGDGFVVLYAYGRRGDTMKLGAKTQGPVDYETAKKAYDKVVKGQFAKGYTQGEDGTPYHGSDDKQVSGVVPQLLNPINEEEAMKYIEDPNWWAQEKFDGKHLMIRRDGAKVEGINKKGLVVALSQSIVDEVMKVLDQKFICDGEAMGDRYATHGLLETNVDLRTQMYRHQMDVLSTLFARQYPGRTASGAKHDAGPGIDQNVFWIAWTARTTEEKQALWAWLKNNNKEGIVFKRWAATYTPGRPSSGGDMLKCKFWATLSAIVTKRNGTKRSVALHLLGDKSVVIPMGNCTIPANAEIPQAGAVVEIRYLYCYPLPGGSLYQPIYLGQRDDVYPYECSISQLKFKPTDSDEE